MMTQEQKDEILVKRVKLNTKRKLVYGWGVNDADYVVETREDGIYVRCPYYMTWRNMVKRCYSGQYPSYIDVEVCSEWKYFSKFKAWMITQDWEGLELDKDLLYRGNKVYSPETCIFISGRINKFIYESSKGPYPTGVVFHRQTGKFLAKCTDLYVGVQRHLGLYRTADEAERSYLTYKNKLANELADSQTNPRVAEALRKRYKRSIFSKTDKEEIFRRYSLWVDHVCDDLPEKTHFNAEEIVMKVLGLAEEYFE